MVRHFKQGDVIEKCNGITFDFYIYTRLSHVTNVYGGTTEMNHCCTYVCVLEASGTFLIGIIILSMHISPGTTRRV